MKNEKEVSAKLTEEELEKVVGGSVIKNDFGREMKPCPETIPGSQNEPTIPEIMEP